MHNQGRQVILQLGDGNSYHHGNNIFIQNSRPISEEMVQRLLEALPFDGIKFRIFIESDRGQCDFPVQPSFTVQCVKILLALIHGIPENNIVLLFKKQILDDQLLIKDYGINGDDHLKMLYHYSQSDLTILVEPEYGRMFCVPVQNDWTVQRVKRAIEEKECLPAQYQHISVDGIECIDANSIHIYNFKKIIKLIDKRQIILESSSIRIHEITNLKDKRIQIFVETLTGKTLTISTKLDRTIFDIKHKIYGTEGIPPDQQRIFNTNNLQLEDSRTLASYGITKESTLVMVVRLRGYTSCLNYNLDSVTKKNYNVFICYKIGDLVLLDYIGTLNPNETTTVGCIRTEVHWRRGLLNDQRIFLNDKELKDYTKHIIDYIIDYVTP